VRRALILLIAVGFLAACGSSASTPAARVLPITFGTEGGNIAPFTIEISRSGAIVESSGTLALTKKHVASAVMLAVQQGFAAVRTRQCAGTLPDVASRFIKVGARQKTVHGGCDAGFDQLWGKLTSAVGLD
jgi:hypothetical protein